MTIADSPPNPAWLRRLRVAAITAWGCAIVAGWLWMKADDFNPARGPVAARNGWPADSRIALDGERTTLVMFVHPKCPCTSATIAELERTLCRAQGTLPRTFVLASTPSDPGLEWTDTPTLRRCRMLPDAQVMVDEGGVEASRFGVVVSGTILVYDPAGRLRYAGGITATRGHEGDNPGADALTLVLGDSKESVSNCPPTGCRLVRESLMDAPMATAAGSVDLANGPVLTAELGRVN